MSKKKGKKPTGNTIAVNRRARHDYFIEDRFEAGPLRRAGRATFRALIADADSTLVVVARFLSLLELYREGVVRFEQMVSLGELQITWIGTASGEIRVSDEFDLPVQTVDEADNV